jgi:hypothetical protein
VDALERKPQLNSIKGISSSMASVLSQSMQFGFQCLPVAEIQTIKHGNIMVVAG